MRALSNNVELVGDAVALARLRWVQETQRRLLLEGYPHYGRSDSAVLRRLLREPSSFVDLVNTLGVSRQGVRKVVSGLEARGLVEVGTDTLDARRAVISLSEAGRRYAVVLQREARRMHRDISAVVSGDDMASALRVLNTVATRWDANVE
jgi:DNA-binding MarR family transcriptional regulator